MENNKRPEVEIDFLKLAKTPSRWFGLIYPVIIAGILIAGKFYVDNMATIERNMTPPAKTNIPDYSKDLLPKKGMVLAGIELDILTNPDEELLAKGKELYTSTCASCHGDAGKGDGVAGASMNPKPRDFTTTEGWTNGRKFEDFYKTLEEGIVANGMVSYSYMPPKDRIALIHYIRKNFGSDYPETTEEDIQTLDMTYKLTEGMTTSPQIPVAQAEEIIQKDQSKMMKDVEMLSKAVQNDRIYQEAATFKSATYSVRKAMTVLSKDLTWIDDTDKMLDVITSNVGENGFNVEALKIDKEKWDAVRKYLALKFS